MSILDQQAGVFLYPLMYPTSGNNLTGENGDTINDIVNDPDSTEERGVGDVTIVNGRARVRPGNFKPVELPIGGESDGGSGRMLRNATRNALNATGNR
jgi:hypothetical protein